ncbi:alpha/beta hydrolase [Aquimarina sp. 2201CG5-10]|uniref:alpha/beta hydrolase n=1 Tax=Aquimarina callyspongiae TaxID=3098150 RepID=UPI002AB3B9D4|nr:alpha/beta fold hydrolase [Aquimarina sp. 2201CG5-10]MDY8135273.1 alpha/beta fold hydrolase [Aquimarina sp. 2201CG5-10]
MKKVYKITKWILLLGILIFVLLVLYIRFSRYTDTMIYKTNDIGYSVFKTAFDYEEYYFHRDNNVKIHGVLFKTKTLFPKGTIIHYAGKGMHLQSSQKYYKALLQRGFQVFSFERRGFGKSTGIADNSLVLKEDALYVFDEILKHKNVIDTPIIIWGQSLGGAFATMNAAARQEKIKGLVLEGTFSSFPDIGKVYANALHLENFKGVVPLLMNNDFPAEKEIKKITKPSLIIHSQTDQQVPYELGKKLYDASHLSSTQFWEIKGKHIRGIFDYEEKYVALFEKMISQ